MTVTEQPHAQAYERIEETKSDIASVQTRIALDEADEFDRQFFQAQGKLKLTKDQKRQLKFMMKNGADISSIADL